MVAVVSQLEASRCATRTEEFFRAKVILMGWREIRLPSGSTLKSEKVKKGKREHNGDAIASLVHDKIILVEQANSLRKRKEELSKLLERKESSAKLLQYMQM